MFSLSILALLSPLLLPFPVDAALECRPPGPVLPRPQDVSEHPILISATGILMRSLESALAGEIEAGWPVENTSFSIGLIMRDQVDAAVPVWEYHHLASTNVNGTKDLTRDSQYLIGSVSKVISDYILLQSKLDLDESIATFIRELADASSFIEWKSITLRHLANQVAGIPPNYGFSEYYYLKDYFESLGFPHLDDEAYAQCGIIGLNGGCTREQFLKGMIESYPIARPAERPVYSNIAFTLLMYAVEGRMGKSYSELLEMYVAEPLGLTNTMASPGDDEKAVIPPVDNSWGSNYGDNTPGGGLVSSLSDLSIFMHGIPNYSVLDSETAVREWLRPTSSTGSFNSLVGTPWEIYRTSELTPNHSHTIDIYAKGGAAYGYQSQVAVIEEYGAGIVLLTAGSALVMTPLYDAILATLVPALDEIAREQAVDKGYTGTFVDSSALPSNSSSLATKRGMDSVAFKVTVMQDEDSLLLQRIERDGKDIIASFYDIWAVTVGQFLDLTPSKARIFPVGIRRDVSMPMPNGRVRKAIQEDWRIDWELALSGHTDLPGASLSAKNCLTWTLTDWIYYGSEPLDRIVFAIDAESGEVVGLDIPYLRSGLLKPI
ncbi:beta-lactamase/transpeptidase-like protein [Xylariaceae sp. FL1651]|nr:beta-lactamase/transpeptidase-like protein [Xylariaceae sp. FL1651]